MDLLPKLTDYHRIWRKAQIHTDLANLLLVPRTIVFLTLPGVLQFQKHGVKLNETTSPFSTASFIRKIAIQQEVLDTCVSVVKNQHVITRLCTDLHPNLAIFPVSKRFTVFQDGGEFQALHTMANMTL
jgi:hypothetical protein